MFSLEMEEVEEMSRIQDIADFENLDRVVINVSGIKFETYENTLARLPHSVLGSPIKRAPYYRSSSNEYFFERNRDAFDSILFYYQSGATDGGILVKPDGIPWQTFEDDVKFFELGQEAEGKIAGSQAEIGCSDRGGFETGRSSQVSCCQNVLSKIADLFEPGRRRSPSFFYRMIDIWTIFITVFFVALLCIKTIPYVRNVLTLNSCCNQTGEDLEMISFFLSFSEKLCVTWFALEYVIRTFCALDKKMYVFSVQGIFDLLSFLPYLLLIIVLELISTDTKTNVLQRILLFAMVFSIFKLTRFSLGLQILLKTFNACVKEIALLFLCVVITLVLFSSMVYYCETTDQSTIFTSIPDTFWFIIVTMTTVGYGDVTPTTIAGKFFSALCAVCGVCCILAIPSTIIVSNFNFFYLKEKARPKQPKRSKPGIAGRQKLLTRFRNFSL